MLASFVSCECWPALRPRRGAVSTAFVSLFLVLVAFAFGRGLLACSTVTVNINLVTGFGYLFSVE